MNELILSESFNKIRDYIKTNDDSESPVVKFNSPSELAENIDFTIPQQGVSENEFLELLDKYLEFSVRTGNKRFLNQLYSGFNFPA